MSLSPKGIYFEELEDSPRVRMRKNGVSATRMFWIPDWSQANAFATELSVNSVLWAWSHNSLCRFRFRGLRIFWSRISISIRWTERVRRD